MGRRRETDCGWADQCRTDHVPSLADRHEPSGSWGSRAGSLAVRNQRTAGATDTKRQVELPSGLAMTPQCQLLGDRTSGCLSELDDDRCVVRSSVQRDQTRSIRPDRSDQAVDEVAFDGGEVRRAFVGRTRDITVGDGAGERRVLLDGLANDLVDLGAVDVVGQH